MLVRAIRVPTRATADSAERSIARNFHLQMPRLKLAKGRHKSGRKLPASAALAQRGPYIRFRGRWVPWRPARHGLKSGHDEKPTQTHKPGRSPVAGFSLPEWRGRQL